MSSMGAACDHIDHVKTQVPYAFTVGTASLITYLVAGAVDSPWCLLLALGLVVFLVFTLGRLFGARVQKS